MSPIRYSKFDKFKSAILSVKEESPLRAIEIFLDDPEVNTAHSGDLCITRCQRPVVFAYQGSGESLIASCDCPASVAQIKKKVLVICRAKVSGILTDLIGIIHNRPEDSHLTLTLRFVIDFSSD